MVGALGSKIAAPKLYAPEVLEAIPRSAGRQALDGIAPPMCGYDCWHLYELSWLNPKQHPQHGVGVLVIDSGSPATIESKSLKLYLNSLNFHCFESEAEANDVICTDIAHVTGSKVSLVMLPPSGLAPITREPDGVLLESYVQGDVTLPGEPWCDLSGAISDSTYVSHRLRSLCPVTSQPDWGTIVIDYRGRPINQRQLLTYIESFREHQEFHEQCVERCFYKLMQETGPESLTVSAYYQRRGGIDITPVRSSYAVAPEYWRTGRQ